MTMTRAQNERFKATVHDAVARIAQALDVDPDDYRVELITRFDDEGPPQKACDTARFELRVEAKDFALEGLRNVFLHEAMSHVNRMLADQGMIATRPYVEVEWHPYLLFPGSQYDTGGEPFLVIAQGDRDGLASMGVDPAEAGARPPDGYVLSVAREGIFR